MYFLRQPSILKNLVLMVLLMSTSTFNLFMIVFTAKNFPGDFQQNQIYLFLGDIPVIILVGYLLSRFRAQNVFIALFVLEALAGFSILALLEANDSGMALPVLLACARGCANGVFISIWTSLTRMFPILFSVTAVGISNIASYALSISIPFIAQISFPIPIMVFTIGSAACALLSSMLEVDHEDSELAD